VQKELKGKGVAEVSLPTEVEVKQEVYQHMIVASMNIHWTTVMLIKECCYGWWMIGHRYK